MSAAADKKDNAARNDPAAKKGVATKKASGIGKVRKYNPERLMTLLLAPVVSELLLVKGSVPGADGGHIIVSAAVKTPAKKGA